MQNITSAPVFLGFFMRRIRPHLGVVPAFVRSVPTCCLLCLRFWVRITTPMGSKFGRTREEAL